MRSSVIIATAKDLKSEICTGRLRFLTSSIKVLTSSASLLVSISPSTCVSGSVAGGDLRSWAEEFEDVFLKGQVLARWDGSLQMKHRLVGAW